MSGRQSNYLAPDGYRYGVRFTDGSVAEWWNGRTQREMAVKFIVGRPDLRVVRKLPDGTWEDVRPYRHLCSDADERDAMDDDTFWGHVADNLTPPDIWEPSPDDEPVDPEGDAPACSVCGSSGACAYDAEGRALIHTTDDDD